MMTEQLFPTPQSSPSLGMSPLLAMYEIAGSPEGLHNIVNASIRPTADAEQPSAEKVMADVPEEEIPPGLGEGFSVLHSIFKADMCAKAKRVELEEGAEEFPARVHEALLRLRVRKYAEELTWSSASTPSTNEFLRGVRWRVLLGAIPADYKTWAEEIRWQREEYSRLREVFSFTQVVPPQPPLLTETGALKSAKLVNTRDLELFEKIDYTQLKKEIRNDILRTYMDNPFFAQKEIRDILNSVLYVYARTHSDLGYIQGMNEILAPMVYVLYKDWEAVNDTLVKECGADPSNAELRALSAVVKREYIEHDAYRMFLRLMEVIGPLFNSPDSNSKRSSESIGYVEIFGRCNEIQRMLAEKDPELEERLTTLGIQPQLYMLRWVRIIFAQVFPLTDIIMFWDAIFAVGPPYRLVDHICVTLLILVRDSIVGHELSDALSVLFHYPHSTVPAALIIPIAINSFFSGKNSRMFTNNTSLPPPRVTMPRFLMSYKCECAQKDIEKNGLQQPAAEMDPTGSDRPWQLRSAINKKLSFFKTISEISEEEILRRKKEEEEQNEAFLQVVKSENEALAQEARALDEVNQLVLMRVDRDISILKKCFILSPGFKPPSLDVAAKASMLRKKLAELEAIKAQLQKVMADEYR